MSVAIRAVRPEDRSDWARLWEAYLTFYETARDAEVYAASWERIMDPAQEMYAALAVDEQGTPVGLANYLLHRSFWDVAPSCYLNDLYVDPACRGGGAGRKLLSFVKDHSDALGAAKLYWLTAEDNATARALYDRVASKTPFVHYVMKGR